MTMTVRELRDKLERFEDDLEIFIDRDALPLANDLWAVVGADNTRFDTPRPVPITHPLERRTLAQAEVDGDEGLRVAISL